MHWEPFVEGPIAPFDGTTAAKSSGPAHSPTRGSEQDEQGKRGRRAGAVPPLPLITTLVVPLDVLLVKPARQNTRCVSGYPVHAV